MSQPWERQEGETEKAFAAFCEYRNMGSDRGLEKLAGRRKGEERAKVPGHFSRWSSAHNWQSRAASWDAYKDSIALSVVEKGIVSDREEYRRRVKEEAKIFATEALRLLANVSNTPDITEQATGIRAAIAAWEKARHIEGVALGLVVG